MDLESFYLHLLKLTSPWYVKAVVLEDGIEHVNVYIGHSDDARLPCPECGKYCEVCGHGEERKLRHLNTCHAATYIYISLPVVNCPDHGERPVVFRWVLPESNITVAFDRWYGKLKRGAGVKEAARLTGLDQEPGSSTAAGRADLSTKSRRRTSCRNTDETQAPHAKQLSLFAQEDMAYINEGIRALRDLRLEIALELFEKHKRVYPKGKNVDSKAAAANFLILGFEKAPDIPSERPAYFCGLWDAFEENPSFKDVGRSTVIAEMKRAFFEKVLDELEQSGMADVPLISMGIPTGYVYLQAGKYDRAIKSLQACIPENPNNAAAYGYLGDAYFLRGNVKVARQCYREACLIDPAAMDWRSLKDQALKDLMQEISLEFGLSDELALVWLPSHARISGLFERKVIRLNQGLKEAVDEYLATLNAMQKDDKGFQWKARLFFRGIILCDNEENLRFIKKIHLSEVRKAMQQANPTLFAEYLEKVAGKEN